MKNTTELPPTLVEALVAVPKKELDEKLAKYNRQKLKRKHAVR
jgi:hypothetical protein